MHYILYSAELIHSRTHTHAHQKLLYEARMHPLYQHQKQQHIIKHAITNTRLCAYGGIEFVEIMPAAKINASELKKLCARVLIIHIYTIQNTVELARCV